MLIVVAAMLAATLITVAFGNDDPPGPGVVVEWLTDGDDPADTPGPTLPPVITGRSTPSATPGTGLPAGVANFTYPVVGGCLPESDDLMPGAPREYRDGIHEGVDFYDSDNCTVLGAGSDILAAQAGTVVRADLGYQELTPQELAELDAQVANGQADEAVLDAFRGRQVWIDHGHGVRTRYAHLSGIAEGIAIGTDVARGDVIGYMGESGSPESVTDPGTQVHLHFELRVGSGYLGQGLPPAGVRALYLEAFAP